MWSRDCGAQCDPTFETCYIQASIVSFSIQYFAPHHSTIKNLCRQVRWQEESVFVLCSSWSFVSGAYHLLLVKVSPAKFSHVLFSLPPPLHQLLQAKMSLINCPMCIYVSSSLVKVSPTNCSCLYMHWTPTPQHYHFNLHLFLWCPRKKRHFWSFWSLENVKFL